MVFPVAYAAVAGVIGIAGYLYINGRPTKVFISYHSKGDGHFKNMIMAWANNEKFKLNIEDFSTDTNIKSKDEAYLKRRMREQIRKADNFIVFIGKDTHKRPWVAWEIEQAKALSKRIIAVKENRKHISPKPLLGSGAIWVYGFSANGIRNALNT
ncbi:MAG: TIR domain-containing protein [Gammaproteobacteria bacterium]|nr:TIR domain-containing protein [Gammaproteobacteria bacterium]